MTGVIAVTDVHYPPAGGARAAAVLSEDRRLAGITGERVVLLDEVADYRPGEFYRRELPCLEKVMGVVQDLTLLIVDGYVDLDPEGQRPGLGRYAHRAFGVPVIGVAKTRFRAATHAAQVLRGDATKPLYVTAAGLDVAEAAAMVAAMAGPFRLPDALKRVDRLARGGQG